MRPESQSKSGPAEHSRGIMAGAHNTLTINAVKHIHLFILRFPLPMDSSFFCLTRRRVRPSSAVTIRANVCEVIRQVPPMRVVANIHVMSARGARDALPKR